MFSKITLAAVAQFALFSGAVSAATVTKSTTIDAAPSEVWAASADDFCGIGHFHPAIEKCALSNGGTRASSD